MTRWAPRPERALREIGERRDERLALARAHLGDFALVEDHAAHELDVVVALPDRAPRGLAHEREDLDELPVEDLAGKRTPLFDPLGKVPQAIPHARADFGHAGADLLVGERLDPGLQCVDFLDARHHRLDVALVLRPEDLGECLVDDHEGIARAKSARERKSLAGEKIFSEGVEGSGDGALRRRRGFPEDREAALPLSDGGAVRKRSRRSRAGSPVCRRCAPRNGGAAR